MQGLPPRRLGPVELPLDKYLASRVGAWPCAGAVHAGPVKPPARIGIGNEDGPRKGMQKNRISRLFAHSVPGKQHVPQARRGSSREVPQTAGGQHAGSQVPKSRGLYALATSRTNQQCKPVGRHRRQRLGYQQTGRTKPRDGRSDVSPSGVLHQHRADHHFEARSRRPPARGRVSADQGFAKARQPLSDGGFGLPGHLAGVAAAAARRRCKGYREAPPSPADDARGADRAVTGPDRSAPGSGG
jgi:hypothetical protein